jgi:flagellin
MIRVVDSMFTQMTDAASNLGAVNKRVSMQEDFVSNLQDRSTRVSVVWSTRT